MDTLYSFRKTGCLIRRPEGMPAPGPYYTCLVDMRDLPDFTYDYALYFSTDHHGGAGGIWLYVCDGSPLVAANWLSYDEALAAGGFAHLARKPAANPIYHDTVQGTGHTETPHAAVLNGILFLSYHRNGISRSQKTIMSTSIDGVNFTRINGDEDSVILDYAHGTRPGDGHTGYFRWAPNPFAEVDANYVGYSLHGGGDQYYSALWGSDDGCSWRELAVLTPTEGMALDDPEQMIIWHELDPGSIRRLPTGEYAAITAVGNRASGNAARISELYEIYLAADGVTLTRQARRLLAVGDAEAADSEELSSPCVVSTPDGVGLIYVGAADSGRENSILVASGSFRDEPPSSPPIDPATLPAYISRP